ncbi:MAG TPA: hypothetical protein VJV22_13725, partial [Acidobacteriaceae bacterium]|nr:hypothetical protein [Acidobacteriaceae bacterium]
MPGSEPQPNPSTLPRPSGQPSDQAAAAAAPPPKSAHQEEEVLGKAYDSRLMGRLIRYLFPY